MLEKEFKTYDELIEILKSRGMNLSTHLFATLLIFSMMLPKSQFRSAVNQIDSRISGLNEKLSVLSKDEILTCMGFPIEWKSQLLSL